MEGIIALYIDPKREFNPSALTATDPLYGIVQRKKAGRHLWNTLSTVCIHELQADRKSANYPAVIGRSFAGSLDVS